MIKRLLLPLLLIFIITAGFTQQKSAVRRSTITFQVKNLGINSTGTISGLQAEIHFNPANLSSSSIDASVDVNTINTDNAERDDHLKSDAFFDVAHYPKITMKSVSLKHRSGNNYTGLFNLTIKGKAKTLEIPFSCIQRGNAMAFKSSFKLNRLDFGVGETSMILSNDVTVNIDAEVEVRD
jgi:polyisoprenoid-binding protein YceI